MKSESHNAMDQKHAKFDKPGDGKFNSLEDRSRTLCEPKSADHENVIKAKYIKEQTNWKF